MKGSTKLLLGAGLCVLLAVAITHATMQGQYSLNIHFVPPLVTGSCALAQFWSPPNVTCALCFCMTGTLSRCIPQPGCSPSNATTNSTTPAPGVTTTTVASGANVQPSTETATVIPAPGPADNMAAPAPTAAPAPAPAPGPGPAPAEGVTQLPPAVVRNRRGSGNPIVRKRKDKF